MHPLRPLRAGLPLLCALTFLAVPLRAAASEPKLRIIHLDVGQGDGAVILTPGGQVVMIDDGGAVYPVTPCAKILSQLAALGVTHVDYHFASHMHADHIGCFDSVDKVVHFGQGWDDNGPYVSSAVTRYKNSLGGRRHVIADSLGTGKGRVFTLDSTLAHPVTLTVVDYHSHNKSDENLNSVMLRLDYGNFHESFGGDLPADGSPDYGYETEYGAEVDTVLVYKVHHHSSAYSSSDAWLNATAPKAGIISLGNGNPYYFPTLATMTRLHNHGVKTYWTELGTGVSPVAGQDKVAGGPITISAPWDGGGKVVISGGSGASAFSDTFTNPGLPVPVGVDDRATAARPLRVLRNPAGGSAAFAVEVVGSPVSDLRIYSVDGRQVRTVFRGVLAQGEQVLSWDGRDEGGRRADSGMYFARFLARGRAETVSFVLVR